MMGSSESRYDNYLRNLISFTMVNILWQIGSTLVLPETSLIYFLKQVNASNLAVSAVVPVFMFFNSVPCILWGAVIHINKNMRKVLYLSCIWTVVPYLAIYLMLGNMNGNGFYFVPCLFLLLICSNLGLSLECVAYQNYVSYVVPEKKRGTLWGIVFSFGYIISLLAYPIMNALNERLDTFQYYRAGFLIFFIFALIATQFFLFVKEPKEEVHSTAQKINWYEYFCSCKDILAKDKNFRIYLLLQYLANFSICITTFSLVYFINLFNIPNEDTIKFMIIYCIVFGVGSYIGGRIGDKKGFRFIMLAALSIQIIFTFILLLNKDKFLVLIIYGVIVLGLAMKEVAVINIPIDSTSSINKSQYIGIANTITAPSLLISLLFGRLVDIGIVSVRNVLGISIIGLTASFILNGIFFKEPRNSFENNK